MKILLLGEYSNLHWTLARGLRQLGHEVTVASNGDFWKAYPRDIDLARRPGKWGGLRLLARVYRQLPRFTGYDIVQFINPMFFELRAQRLFPLYRFLRRHNRRVVLGAFGMDYYWVHTCITEKPLRYSDFNIGEELRTDEAALRERADWVGTAKERLNRLMAGEAAAIVSCLYEYDVCYRHHFPEKTHYIPLPIDIPDTADGIAAAESTEAAHSLAGPIKLFIGISRGRSAYKGTDIMLRAAEDIVAKYAGHVVLRKAEGLPFSEYQQMMDGSDVLLDQLYSYTPSMNTLLAMSKGIVCIGGGEPENYEILNERELRPIVNVEPTYQSVYQQLEQLILHPELLPRLKRESIEYVRRHHDYLKVARQYEAFYRQISEKE
jgi:glycosyltransferase involved in cell wall biosynthesis